MNSDELKAKVNELRKTPDYHVVEEAIKVIEAAGWKIGVFAYREQVTHTSARRSRLLKNPRWQWRTVGHWFKGQEAVWYYNNSQFRKEYAVDAVKRYPVPDWFKAQTLSTASNPKHMVF